MSDLLYAKIVGNKKIIHKNILKKLTAKKCEIVEFLYFESLVWIISVKTESENKNIWIIKISLMVVLIFKIWSNNKFIATKTTNKIALLFFIMIYCFFKHIVQCQKYWN